MATTTTITTTTDNDDDYFKFYNNNNSSNNNNSNVSSNFSIKNGNIDISTNLSKLLDASASTIIQNSTTVGPTDTATVAQQQSTTTATSISSFLSTTANTLTSLNSNSSNNTNTNNEIFNDNNNNTNSFNPIYYQLKNSSDYNNEIITDYNNSSQNFLVNDFSQDNNSSNNNSGNNFSINDSAKLSYESGSNFMLLLEDFGEYFYNYNGSDFNSTSTIPYPANCSLNSTSCGEDTITQYNYWALILILFPFLTLFGNVLVILAVCRERTLQTVTNYFIVSLAIADLLVAVVVMPFGVYILVNGAWSLPNVVCDFYIAMDVICSTSSIFNLVAISIDRYIAVTQPIKYAKHKNSRRVCLTILLVWAISAAIGSPIVLGLNNTPDRVPDLCLFYNSDFIVYSSLSSFYIPCIIMVFLYWNIFKALRIRAKKQRAARKPHISDLATSGSVIENVAQTKKLAETIIDGKNKNGAKILPDDDRPTNTGSGSNEDDDVGSPDADDCHVIVNDKSTDFMLATVVEETSNVMAQITTTQSDPNGNPDSGYAPSHIIDDILPSSCSPTGSPHHATIFVNRNVQYKSKNGSSSKNTTLSSASPLKEPFSASIKPISVVHCDAQGLTIARNDSTLSTNSRDSSRKDSKNIQASRFTIYKVNKASKKKREKSSAKKERKATKTLAIVLGVFLICWVPFFTCNIMDAMCTKMNMDCQPGITAFILTTWLGYMNSFVNPVIYTIFNPEFRKAFKKIMNMA